MTSTLALGDGEGRCQRERRRLQIVGTVRSGARALSVWSMREAVFAGRSRRAGSRLPKADVCQPKYRCGTVNPRRLPCSVTESVRSPGYCLKHKDVANPSADHQIVFHCPVTCLPLDLDRLPPVNQQAVHARLECQSVVREQACDPSLRPVQPTSVSGASILAASRGQKQRFELSRIQRLHSRVLVGSLPLPTRRP